MHAQRLVMVTLGCPRQLHSMTVSPGGALQRHPLLLPLIGSTVKVLIRLTASVMSVVTWHATFDPKLMLVLVAQSASSTDPHHSAFADVGGGAAAVGRDDGDFTKQLLLLEQQEQ